MLTLLAAALSMALKDGLGTALVIAEARGRAWTAGALDAAYDLAVILSTVFGAGEIIAHGWTGRTLLILVVMCTVSFFGTILWTRLATKLMPSPSAGGVA